MLLQLLLESLELSDGDGVSGVDTESMSHSGVGSHGRPLNGRRVSPNIIATSSLRLTSTHSIRAKLPGAQIGWPPYSTAEGVSNSSVFTFPSITLSIFGSFRISFTVHFAPSRVHPFSSVVTQGQHIVCPECAQISLRRVSTVHCLVTSIVPSCMTTGRTA